MKENIDLKGKKQQIQIQKSNLDFYFEGVAEIWDKPHLSEVSFDMTDKIRGEKPSIHYSLLLTNLNITQIQI